MLEQPYSVEATLVAGHACNASLMTARELVVKSTKFRSVSPGRGGFLRLPGARGDKLTTCHASICSGNFLYQKIYIKLNFTI